MRIVNTMCISKEKLYVTVKVFDGKFRNYPAWGRGALNTNLKTSKSGVCLDQNWMFVDKGEEKGGGPKFRLFADVINE